MRDPLVSILVPVYKTEQFIERCAISIFEQTYKNIEFVFVNDATPDHSIEKLQNIIKKYPQRERNVKIIHHDENKGLAAVRNTLIDNAAGDFICFVDSDDYVEASIVEKCVSRLLATGAQIVSAAFYIHDGEKVVKQNHHNYQNKREYCQSLIKRKTYPVIWGRLIDRNLFVKWNIRFDQDASFGEDWHTTPRLFYYAQEYTFIEDGCYHYILSQNTNSFTYSFSAKRDRQLLRAAAVLCDFFKDKDTILYSASQQMFYAQIVGSLYSCIKHKEYGDFYEELKMKSKSLPLDIKRNTYWLHKPLLYIDNTRMEDVYVNVFVKVFLSMRNILKDHGFQS